MFSSVNLRASARCGTVHASRRRCPCPEVTCVPDSPGRPPRARRQSCCTPIPLRAQQTLNFSVGEFSVRGEDARVDGDVLVANRDIFLFDFNDFNSPSIGAEWLVPLGDYLEVGAGIGFTTRTVPTRSTTTSSGRTARRSSRSSSCASCRSRRPCACCRSAATARSSRTSAAASASTTGATARPAISSTSRCRGARSSATATSASGTAVGPVAVFGARVPMGKRHVGGEVRYQKAEGDLDERDFLGPKIDLGGFHYVGDVRGSASRGGRRDVASDGGSGSRVERFAGTAHVPPSQTRSKPSSNRGKAR